ncbi:glycosyltransferase family 4 protein [Proteiniphilum sp.]|uniref:glycosyltransferase family 4 protein n=1 Tax=Proteiniphilum sp. TaxID=1926877 RepID=UPI003323E945
MKVLWFSSRFFTEEKISGTATWLDAMADILMDKDDIQLYNISQGKTKTIRKSNYKKVVQWQVPNTWKKKDQIPREKYLRQITEIVSSITPDVIHIWGTESYWGLLTARGYIKGNTVLEIQGLISQIVNEFYGRLTMRELIASVGIKEVVKPELLLFNIKKEFEKHARYELEMIRNHSYISTQSEWVRANILFLNENAKLIETRIPLRKNFITSEKWNSERCTAYTIFTSISSTAPYKGLHVLIDTLPLLKKRYPGLKLMIAGHTGRGIREDGYTKFIKRKLSKQGLNENVTWLGPLDETGIIDQLLKSNVAVFPTFIESYGVAVAESLRLGVPTVASYVGALPEQDREGNSMLFFPPGDVNMCAYSIHQIFSNRVFSEELSMNALKKTAPTLEEIAELQVSIYKEVCREE